MEFEKRYTPKEVAEMLNVSVSTIYEFARRSPDAGGIPSMKIGKAVRIRESDLKAWMTGLERKPGVSRR